MAVESRMVELGIEMPAFSDLPISNPWVDHLDAPGRSSADYSGSSIVVVVFTCNHCPYAVHVEDALNGVAREYESRGVQFVAINSNDASRYPADSFESMTVRAREKSFVFPYLHDESQEVARAYDAACTPDTYVFDSNRILVYRGRIDETRPRRGETAHGGDLRAALDAILRGDAPASDQYPSVGCSIKWRD